MEYISFFVGSGFSDQALDAAAKRPLAFFGADAGSIDVGPYQLAGVGTMFSEDLCRHDLRRSLVAARQMGVPLLIGSCGGSGSDWGVDWVATMVRDIAAEHNLSFTLARIYSELEPGYLKDKIRGGRIHPLGGLRVDYTTESVDRATRTVGVMGAEPFIAALQSGADVILAGRATDPAIFAAYPIMKGVPVSVAWHAAKLAECGASIAEPAKNDLLHVTLEDDSFIVAPLTDTQACTPLSVGAQQLYENAHPAEVLEPSGKLTLYQATYEAVGPRATRVRGSVFEPSPQYTAKLEGVELAGYQTIAMVSFTDRVLLEDFPEWLRQARESIETKARRVYGDEVDTARLSVRSYGTGTGTELFPGRPAQPPADEVIILLDVVAPRQNLATGMANIAWHTMIHSPTPGWTGALLTGAWPYNPPLLERGPIYRFNVNHAIEVDDPLEFVRMELEQVGAAA
jgi:Acyclic terpene utilisation family protein AtuA